MGDWVKVRIEDICTLGRGRVISTQEVAETPGTYPVYSSQTANNGEMGRIRTYDFEGEYVTWTTDGANAGTVFYRNGRFNCTNVCGTLQSKRKLSIAFLAYVLGSVAKNHVSYVGNPKLMNNIVAKIEIKIPNSFQEQTTIATILTTIDQAIEKTAQLIAKYERIKTGLMQDLLTRGIDENGNIRSEETHEFKDSELGRIPVDWEVREMKEVCDKIQDGTHFSPKTSSIGDFLYITSKNIRMGELDLKNVEYLTKEAHEEIYRRCSVIFGDVLLTKDGANTGNISLNTIKEPISLLSSVAFLRGKKNIMRNDFLFQVLSSEKAQKALRDQMSGNAITRITLQKINATQVIVPKVEEQNRIVSFLQSYDNIWFKEKENLSKYGLLKTALMQDLLSGKVRVDAILDIKSINPY